MTDKKLVLAAYPNACIRTYKAYTKSGTILPGKIAYIVSIAHGRHPRIDICTFPYYEHCFTEEDAWNDAAIAVKHEMVRRLSE